MANIYVDFALASGANNGTSWANAYQGGAGLVTAANAAAAGDDIWVKGQGSVSSNMSVVFTNGTFSNPVKVVGVKSTTTNAPPQASDLISGIRNGGSSPAYLDADVPKITATGTTINITLNGIGKMWGISLAASNTLTVNASSIAKAGGESYDECNFETNYNASTGKSISIGNVSANGAVAPSPITFVNCRFRLNSSTDFMQVVVAAKFFNCVFDSRSAYRSGYLTGSTANPQVHFWGCDFGSLTGAIVDVANLQSELFFYGCKFPSSYTLVTGTRTNQGWTITNIGSQANPSFSSSDSIRNFDLESPQGTIVESTSIVRTGGANDGGSGTYAWAMTPTANTTRNNWQPLVSPWMTANVNAGSQTLTVYIANSGAGDYKNDEVALEVFSPAETTSTVQIAYRDTRCALLGTPATITDDTSSDWGTGAGGRNAQKLTVTIAPAYKGQVFVRVLFYKNFAASPETLYVDPEIYGAATPTRGTFQLGLFGGYAGGPDPASGGAIVIPGRAGSLSRR